MTGLAIGAGIAVIDGLYAALGAAGAAPLLTIDGLRTVLGLLGAAVLISLGTKTVISAFRVRAGLEAAEEVASPRKAFLTALGATASNPLTIASWAAVFAAASTADVAEHSVLLVLGVGIGSLAWCSLLACVCAAARQRVGPRLLQVDRRRRGRGDRRLRRPARLPDAAATRPGPAAARPRAGSGTR